MKCLFLTLILTGFFLISNGQQYRSENPDFVEDLPFDENGNLIFSEMIEVPGAKAAEIYMLFKYGFITNPLKRVMPLEIREEKKMNVFRGKKESDFMHARFIEKWEFMDGRFRYAIKILDFIEYRKDPNKDHGFLEKTIALEKFLSKKNYYDESGKPKQLNAEISNKMVTRFTTTVTRLNDIGIAPIVANERAISNEEKENNWQSQIEGLPKDLPFRKYLDKNFEFLNDEVRIIYRGTFQTTLNKSDQFNRITKFLDVKLDYIDRKGFNDTLAFDIKMSNEIQDGKKSRGIYWNISLIPGNKGCRYSFGAMEILGYSVKKPSQLKESSSETQEINSYALKMYNQFAELFTTGVGEKESWNLIERNNEWKSESLNYPQNLPFNEDGALIYSGVVKAEGDTNAQYDQIKKFVVDNYVIDDMNLKPVIIDDKGESVSFPLRGEIVPKKNYIRYDESFSWYNQYKTFSFNGQLTTWKGLKEIILKYRAVFTFNQDKCKYEFIINAFGEDDLRTVFKGKDSAKLEKEIKFLNDNFDMLVGELVTTMSALKKGVKKKNDDF